MPYTEEARVGAELGTFRLGYFLPNIVVQIDGSDRTDGALVESLSVTDYLNGQPNEATIVVRGFTPAVGTEIKIGYGGSLHPLDLIFGGHILSITRAYPAADKTEIFHALQCVSYEWLLNRRLVTKRYISETASEIARDLIETFASGISDAGIEQGLDTLDEFSATEEPLGSVLDRLAERIGASWFVDYGKTLRFGFDVSMGGSVNAITEDEPNGLQEGSLSYREDFSQVRTRVRLEGGGSNLAGDVALGETILPVIDATWYAEDGGDLVCEAQRLTYDGKQENEGGAIVGVLFAPSTAPTVALQAGAGIDDGAHQWAVTFYDGSGETTPSPLSASLTTGQLTAPGSNPTPSKGLNGNLSAGQYRWKYTNFDSAGGETTAGSATAIVTMDDVSRPDSASLWPVGGWLGATFGPGTYKWKVTFYTADGETDAVNEATFTFGSGGLADFGVNNLPVSGDSRVIGRKLYRTVKDGSTFKLAKTIPNNTATWVNDDTPDGSLGATVPSSNTALSRRATLTVPVGPSGTAKRGIYRTEANGSTYKKVGELSGNVATSYDDNVADGSLGATEPSSNTTAIRQAALTSIPLGPTGTTGRRIYRTPVGSSQLKRVTELANNSATTYTDTTADSALTTNVPTSNTSTLTNPTGTVNAGAATVPVTGSGAFRSGGGWAYASGQYIRYTGLTTSSLTGVPATGIGAILATINYGAQILSVPAIVGVPSSGDGSVVRALPRNAAVNVVAIADDEAAQDAMAAAVGGDGIHELPMRDGRLSLTEATERALAKLQEVKDPVREVSYQTFDQTTRSGLEVAITLPDQQITGTFRIQQVTLTGFDAAGVNRPLRTVVASSRRFSFEQLLRLIQSGR